MPEHTTMIFKKSFIQKGQFGLSNMIKILLRLIRYEIQFHVFIKLLPIHMHIYVIDHHARRV